MLKWSVEFASGEVIHQENHPRFDFTEDVKSIQGPSIVYVMLRNDQNQEVAVAHIPVGCEPVYHVLNAGAVGAATPQCTRIGWQLGKHRTMLVVPTNGGPTGVMEDYLP